MQNRLIGVEISMILIKWGELVINRGYYRLPERLPCDIRANDRPVLVNCAGSVSLASPFTTFIRGGRRDWYLMVILTGDGCACQR